MEDGLAYTDVIEPRFGNAEGTAIDCLVVFTSFGPEPLPFNAVPDDPEPHGREIFDRCLAGEFGPVAPFEGAPARAETSATVKAILDKPDVRAFRAGAHKPAAAPAPKKRKRERLGPPTPPVLVKKRKPPAPAKPPKRKR